MSVTFSQSEIAAFPDRGQAGLRLTLDPGNEGMYLAHDLGANQPTLHMRLALAPASLGGGAMRIAGGQDDTGIAQWWCDYDADARLLTVLCNGAVVLSATLNALLWHVLEVKIDTGAGEAELWINGMLQDSATGIAGVAATRRAWIGALFKDTALNGELFMDEWALATEPIGPVMVPAAGAHADDPARWLVVYNGAVADSVTWAEAYRQARGVPLANLLGPNLSAGETINDTQYAELVLAISEYLNHTGLADQIMGILVGYRVPGYVDFGVTGAVDPVPAMLHRDSTLAGSWVNANAHNTLPTRPTFETLEGDWLTARIDGPDLGSALDMIERSSALMEAGLQSETDATLWFDPFAGDGDIIEPHVLQMIEWVESVDRMRLRLPLELSGDLEAPGEPAQFTQIHDDAFLWMWDISLPATPPVEFFAEPAGKRVACIQLHLVEAVATTLRSASPTNWIEQALDAHYAAAVATSRQYSASAVPYPRPFFEAMRRGWTLAEAWYLSLPLLREGLYLVGDPLLKVAFPQRGWEIFGPLDRLEAFDPDAPVHVLREQERALALSKALHPAAADAALYVVRHLDERGRAEASATAVRTFRQGGNASRPPLTPAWPDHLNWPVHVENGQLVMTLMWDRPIGACHVERIQLRGEVDGEAEITSAEPAFDPRRFDVSFALPMPMQEARYRWRVVSEDGAPLVTPWSHRVRPHAPSTVGLKILEIHP